MTRTRHTNFRFIFLPSLSPPCQSLGRGKIVSPDRISVKRRGATTAAREMLHRFAGVPRDRLPAQQSRSEMRALRPAEAALVLAELRNPVRTYRDGRAMPASPETGQRDYALGCLLADAGLRVSEACGLTWADVTLLERELHVREV